MVQKVIDIGENENEILDLVRTEYGLENNSQAIALILKVYRERFFESEIRPEYIKKLKKIRKGKYTQMFSSTNELRKNIEKNA